MTNKPVKQNTPVTGAEGDVRYSQGQEAQPGVNASADILARLEESNILIAQLQAENEKLRAEKVTSQYTPEQPKDEDALTKLANLLTAALAQNNTNNNGPKEEDTINKVTDFNNQKNMVDSRSLMEAQMAVNEFRSEPKVPVRIEKSFANKFGPTIAVSVNGIRVSVPCDGKMYMINKTHAMHIQERIAKVEIYEANEGGTVTISA